MPSEAGVRQANVLPVLVLDVGDHQNFRMVGQQIILDHMDFQFAESAAEFDMAFVREPLVAKIDHNIVMESLLDLASWIGIAGTILAVDTRGCQARGIETLAHWRAVCDD